MHFIKSLSFLRYLLLSMRFCLLVCLCVPRPLPFAATTTKHGEHHSAEEEAAATVVVVVVDMNTCSAAVPCSPRW